MNEEILNKALQQDFPVNAIEKLTTGKRINFISISKSLHEVTLSERIRCVWHSKTFKLGVYRDDSLIETFQYKSTDPFRMVCEKIVQLKNML